MSSRNDRRARLAHVAGDGAGATSGRSATWRLPPSEFPLSVPASQLPGVGTADSWPLRTYLELGALPGAVPCARLHARQLLWEWGLTELRDDTELLLSELVTNAVAASRAMKSAPPVRIWLLSDKARVVILVWDNNPHAPERAEVDDETESGRGLFLVEALSDIWNWYFPKGMGGKIVWCRISGDSAPAKHGHAAG